MNPRVFIQSDEAEWTGLHKVWSGIQQFAPARRDQARWVRVIRMGAEFVGLVTVLGLIASALWSAG